MRSDPILTMDRRPSAVLSGVFAARATPQVAKLWGQLRRPRWSRTRVFPRRCHRIDGAPGTLGSTCRPFGTSDRLVRISGLRHSRKLDMAHRDMNFLHWPGFSKDNLHRRGSSLR